MHIETCHTAVGIAAPHRTDTIQRGTKEGAQRQRLQIKNRNSFHKRKKNELKKDNRQQRSGNTGRFSMPK